MERRTVDVAGVPVSYLTAGDQTGPVLLLLHGTYWSRVWQPVLDGLAGAGLRPIAVDFPGSGRSGAADRRKCLDPSPGGLAAAISRCAAY